MTRIALSSLVAMCLAASALAEDQVRVWQEDVVIPTYPIGPDDVNPHFYELEGTVIYPYTMQDNLTTEKGDRTYRAWFLENEYLKIMALPEIGGRIQYVIDKRRDEPMFYHNQVIRPGLIALRGAWVSGGIEWNRGPTGHTVTSFSPVDVTGVDNADGSATLVIGNTEMNFRTGWEVRLSLHPGRSYLDEVISLFNPTDGFHPYYFWNNTAFPNRPGTRFIYPMTLGSDHDGTSFFSWPVHEGRDMTRLVNYEAPTSVFAYRAAFDFFGAYDVDRDYGIVQVANHHVLPGKKAWTWGQAESGLVSQSVLTDEDGPYIEVQSGPLLTQADYAMLAPGQEVGWREYWFPALGLGDGFEFATRDVVVQRTERDDGVELRVHATGPFDGAVVELNGAKTVRDLSPDATERFVVNETEVDIVISHDGRELLSYHSPLEVPVETPPALSTRKPPLRTAEDAYLSGYAAELTMDRDAARAGYVAALELDPSHYDSLVALGSLELEAGRFAAAAEKLELAVDRNPERGIAHYLSASAALSLGKLDDALAAGFAASKRRGFLAPGVEIAGRALMRMGQAEGARELFASAYTPGGADHQRLLDGWLIAAVASGREEHALRRAREAVEEGTTRLVPHALLMLAEERTPTALLEMVGEDAFSFQELAFRFAALGQTAEAVRVLESVALDDALTHYLIAYWTRDEPDRSRAALERASARPHDYLFPSRVEMLPILLYAIEEGAGPETHVALGHLYAGLGRFDEAISHWERGKDADGVGSVARRSLAMVAWKRDRDPARASRLFEEAIQARPADQTLYRDLARLKLERSEPEGAVALIEGMELQGRRRPDVTVLLAQAYVAAERYTDAIDLLAATTFSNREGDGSTWRLFSRAHIERGKAQMAAGDLAAAERDFDAALTYPRNLNVGRPARPLLSRALFWKGNLLAARADNEGARAAWSECVAGSPETDEQRRFIRECTDALSR